MQAVAEISTEGKKNHVGERNLCNLWMGMEKLGVREAMSDGVFLLFHCLFCIANDTFVDGRRFPDALELTNRAILEKKGAGSPDGLRRRRRKLAALRINGQVLVWIEEGENKGSQTTCTYRINYGMLLSAWNPMRKIVRLPSRQEPENSPCEAAAVPPHQCSGKGGFHPFKEKKESTHRTPSIINISNSQKSEALGVGNLYDFSLSKTLEEDLENRYKDDEDRMNTVLEKVRSWKVKDVRSCFCRPLTVMWHIITQFEADFQQKHNMKDPGAVLRKRLIDGIETWDNATENTAADVSPEILEEYQLQINREFDTEDGQKKYLLGIVSDFKRRTNMTLENAIKLLDLHGATRDNLFQWNAGC